MVMVIGGDGDSDEVGGEYVKWWNPLAFAYLIKWELMMMFYQEKTFTQLIQLSLKWYILWLERVGEERHSWLIWVTFDLEHEVWPVSHEPYFNPTETR